MREIYCPIRAENMMKLAEMECGCGWPRRSCRKMYPDWWDRQTFVSFFIPMTGLWFWYADR